MRKDNFMHRRFRPLVKSAGLNNIRFDDLRHTSATLSLAAGDNVKVVQERLGHASAKTTLDVYAKAVPSLQKESAARMDTILGAYGGTSGARLEKSRTENAESLMK
jgi:integrase